VNYDSTQDTQEHIQKVYGRLVEVQRLLLARGLAHDASKLEHPEKAGFDVLTLKLRDLVYGSPEYKQALAEAKPVIDHHYAANDHHPEHYDNGVSGMSLLSLLEMVCDWKAASERTKQGSIMQSLEYNKVRFGIDDQLHSILVNTVKELGW